MLTILSYPENPRVWKAIIAGKYNGVDVEYPPFNFGVDNKSEEFLSFNPTGKVPVLLTPEGPIFESNAIARYVARQGTDSLYGSSAYEQGLVDQWVDFSTNEIEYAAVTWLGPILGFLPYQKPAVDKAKQHIDRALACLNKVLASRTFLVGNSITLADIVCVCSLVALFRYVLDRKKRAEFPHVTRWFATCLVQPQFSSTVSQPFTFCEEAADPQPAKQGKKGKKAAQPEKKAAPKQEKKQEKKEVAEEEEEELSAEPAPKAKNPLDELPRSSFNLEEWKRVYSNKDTRGEAIPWFWENFDPQGFSLWRCSYKYNDELKVVFKTSNLASGFTSRADCMRKYAFGILLVCGETDQQSLSGVWIIRGTEFPEFFEKQVDDVELYDWRKLDVSNENDRALAEDYFAWDKPIDGQAVLDGKQFK